MKDCAEEAAPWDSPDTHQEEFATRADDMRREKFLQAGKSRNELAQVLERGASS